MNKLRTVNLNLANYIANNVDELMNFTSASDDNHTRVKLDVSNIVVRENSCNVKGTCLFVLVIPYILYEVTGLEYSRSELTYFLPSKLIKRSEDPEHLHVITNADMLTHFFNMSISHAITTLKVSGCIKNTYIAAMSYVKTLTKCGTDETHLLDIATYFGLEKADIEQAIGKKQEENIVHGSIHTGVVDKSKEQVTTVEVTPNLFGTNIDVKDKTDSK